MRPALILGLLGVLQAACGVSADGDPGGTFTTFHVVVQGGGRVTSDAGSIDCTTGAPGQGPCEVRTFIAWNAPTSERFFHLRASPSPGATFQGWSFAVAADCPGCNVGDPPMGSIDTEGGEATVGVFMNPGYDADLTLTATFAAPRPPR